MADYAHQWLARNQLRLRPRTVEGYSGLLTRHVLPALGPETPVTALTRGGVRDALLSLRAGGLSANTVRLAFVICHGMLQAACDEDELLPRNPAAGLARWFPRPRAEPRRRALPPDQVHQVLASAQHLHAALAVLFTVLYYGGLRIGEGLGLWWDDVDAPRQVLHVRRSVDWRYRIGPPKGGRARRVGLHPEALRALASLEATTRNGVPWVFHGPSGRPWSRVYIWRVLDRACRRAGVPHASVHQLRHSFCSHLADAGVSPWAIRELAGHASVVTTEAYVELADGYLAEVGRLGAGG